MPDPENANTPFVMQLFVERSQKQHVHELVITQRRWVEIVVLYSNGLSQSNSFPLLAKYLTTHLQYHLKAFSSACSVLSESFHA